MINNTTIEIYVTSDAERGTGSNVRFSFLWPKKDRDQEKSMFANGVAFGKIGDTLEQMFKKGTKAIIQGRLTVGFYQDKPQLNFSVEGFPTVIGASSGGSAPQKSARRQAPAPAPADDLPF